VAAYGPPSNNGVADIIELDLRMKGCCFSSKRLTSMGSRSAPELFSFGKGMNAGNSNNKFRWAGQSGSLNGWSHVLGQDRAGHRQEKGKWLGYRIAGGRGKHQPKDVWKKIKSSMARLDRESFVGGRRKIKIVKKSSAGGVPARPKVVKGGRESGRCAKKQSKCYARIRSQYGKGRCHPRRNGLLRPIDYYDKNSSFRDLKVQKASEKSR